MPPQRHSLSLEVVDHEEYVDLDIERGPTGEIVKTLPIEGSRTAFLRLRAPDGHVVRAQIPHEHLDPILALIWPEDFAGWPGDGAPSIGDVSTSG